MKRIWKTKSGQKIKIKNMSINHIRNCLNLLYKYNQYRLKNLLSFSNTLQGECAILHAESQIDNILENGWNDIVDNYIFSFESELEKRNKEEI